jgi:acylglycerol lipase
MRLTPLLIALILVAGCAPQYYPGGVRLHTPAISEHMLTTSDQVELPVRIWPAETGNPKAVIIALHGFNDYSNAFDKPAIWWSKMGLTIYAYDQRGFGAGPHPGYWSGSETMAADLDDAIRATRAIHPNIPLYVLGSSMGGAVILTALGKHDTATNEFVSGVILVGPAVWGGHAMNPILSSILWLGAHTIPANHLTGEGMRIKPSDNIPMLRALGRDPLIIKSSRVDTLYGLTELMGTALNSATDLERPALILGAANDELVPGAAHKALLDSLTTDRTIVTYQKGWHMLLRDLHAKVVWRDVLGWITNRDKPLPSGFGNRLSSIDKK